jgi:hypothetical protein
VAPFEKVNASFAMNLCIDLKGLESGDDEGDEHDQQSEQSACKADFGRSSALVFEAGQDGQDWAKW